MKTHDKRTKNACVCLWKGEDMYESPITQILADIQTIYEADCLKMVQKCGFDVNRTELEKALSYDRNQYQKGYADAREELDILISEFCVPLGIDTICDELHDWDMDLKGETWCSINCGKSNDGQCPSANCYKEWIKMKKVGVT